MEGLDSQSEPDPASLCFSPPPSFFVLFLLAVPSTLAWLPAPALLLQDGSPTPRRALEKGG